VKALYITGSALAVIAFVLVGVFVAKGPQPEIIVPAEKIFDLGPLHVTNTIISAWMAMLVLIVFSYLATRSMKLLPSGMQNFFEAVVEYLVGQIEGVAGEKHGRHMFAIVATIFLFIITANWLGLLPFFNAIGRTDDVGHEIYHELSSTDPSDLKIGADGTYTEGHKFAAWKMDGGGSLLTVAPGGKAADFEVNIGDTPQSALDRYVVFLAKEFTDVKVTDEELKAPPAELVTRAKEALDAKADAPKLITDASLLADHGDEAHGIESPVLGKEVYGVDFDKSQKLALVVPYFRSSFSDVNNTLALGIVAFFIVEFWGFQALGFSYLSKFFNLKGILSFVGILELLSELIRIISFAFRLFGNIFAGEVLVLMLTFLMPFLLVDVIYGLELFVGFIQAAVFALLVLVFGAMAMERHDEEGHEHEAGEHGHTEGAAQVP
jgi:F0F1-type ATP synthase membrane subunit a